MTAPTLKFEQLIDIEMDILSQLDEHTFTGQMDYENTINDYVAAPSGDGGYIVSISNRKGLQGVIEVHSGGVLYKNSAGAIVHRESRMRFPLSLHSIKTYYVPTLMSSI